MAKISSPVLAGIVVVVIFGGIAVSSAAGLWQTTSSRVPIRYQTGEFVGEYNPGDIRGSYSFADVARSFEMDGALLLRAFGFDETLDPATVYAKDLEEIYPPLEDGGEIGTDAVRYFVALYLGRPYTPEEGTRFPVPAVTELEQVLAPADLDVVRSLSVDLTEIVGEATVTPVATTDTATRVPASESEEHDESEAMVRGRTTYRELLDWGVTREQIEATIGREMPGTGTLIRDHLAAEGLEFSVYKAKLQELLDGE